MKRPKLGMWLGGIALAALLCAPAWASIPPQPGVLNYVEGQANIGGMVLNSNSVGSVKLLAGQALNTENGKAEILLTPGVFLRISDNSQIEMVSPDIANTAMTLRKGRALVEVDRIYTANSVRINENGATVQLKKAGLYDFDADHNQIRVFDGIAEVEIAGRSMEVRGGHELTLNTAGKPKVHGFKKQAYEDEFFRWASLRSSYLAEANVDAARRYASYNNGPYPGYYGAGWYGTDWYWDPWFDAYTFIPGDGIFYSPFGWGFYSPWFAFTAPFYGYGYGGYGYGGGYYHHFGPGYHAPFAGMHNQGLLGHAHSVGGAGFHGNAFAGGGAGGFHGGGFGGGGFHGGGFGGGGFHGGGGFGGGGRR